MQYTAAHRNAARAHTAHSVHNISKWANSVALNSLKQLPHTHVLSCPMQVFDAPSTTGSHITTAYADWHSDSSWTVLALHAVAWRGVARLGSQGAAQPQQGTYTAGDRGH